MADSIPAHAAITYETTTEGKALLYYPRSEKISKKLPVFYNPVMKGNRDISVALLHSLGRTQMNIALPLAGTGIRGIRFFKELPEDMIHMLYFNDYNLQAKALIQENIERNGLSAAPYVLESDDANLFLLRSFGFDYIDLDPFGTPNPFLDSAIVRLSRNGILAVTATDTSALSGTFPAACKRKYWAVPMRNELKHEIGLRILIRKIQLIGAQYEKALVPIYSYAKDHYMRVFLHCMKGKERVDLVLKQHGMVQKAGPLWLGILWDPSLAGNIAAFLGDSFTQTIAQEAQIPTVGFYDVHRICKEEKLPVPSMENLFSLLHTQAPAARTHFSPYGIRTSVSFDRFKAAIKACSSKTGCSTPAVSTP